MKHLILIDLQARDIQPIQQLKALRTLTLSTYSTNEFDFAPLQELTDAFVEWRKQYRNLDSCVNLASLYVNKFTEKDLTSIRPLVKPRKLCVGDGWLRSLDGIQDLQRLSSLGLLALPKLSSLSPLYGLATTMEELEINQCRHLESVDVLKELPRLRRVILADCGRVPSLLSLATLSALEELHFYGDTNVVDGSLEFLRTLPLKAVSFKNRRHYSLRREELTAYIA